MTEKSLMAHISKKLPEKVYHSDAIALRRKYPTIGAFLEKYNASILQKVLMVDKERIFCGAAPDFSAVKEVYGLPNLTIWIELLLLNLSEYVGVKEKLREPVARQLALFFIHGYPYLKLSEFAYFLTLLMNGEYGPFYGSVDPMIITTAFKKFIHDRDYTLYRLDLTTNPN